MTPKSPFDTPDEELINRLLALGAADSEDEAKEVLTRIRANAVAYKQGRYQSWAEVKKELGL